MNRTQRAVVALALGAASLAGAAAAQAPMGKMEPMTKTQQDKMAACKKMTHDAMMKDADCVKLSKMHDDGMKKDSMSKGGAMTLKSGM